MVLVQNHTPFLVIRFSTAKSLLYLLFFFRPYTLQNLKRIRGCRAETPLYKISDINGQATFKDNPNQYESEINIWALMNLLDFSRWSLTVEVEI
jgi:hypothetical protein